MTVQKMIAIIYPESDKLSYVYLFCLCLGIQHNALEKHV